MTGETLGSRPLVAAVSGQDLGDDRHVEWPSAGGNIGIRRSVFAGLTWRR